MNPYEIDPYGIMFVMNPVPPLEYPNELTPLPKYKAVSALELKAKQINEENENLWRLLEEVKIENQNAINELLRVEQEVVWEEESDDPDLIDSPDHQPIDLGKEPL